MTGRLSGVGVGPGDPELITLKAARLIGAAQVIAYHQGVGKQSNARRIAAGLFPDDVIEEALVYPVTTQSTEHPGGYAGAMADFYAEAAERLRAHLRAGRDVVVLAEGDPMLYGSFMYLHDRLAGEFDTQVVAGVPAFAAATATTALPLVRQTDVLTVLPGTLPEPELARRLADTDGAVIMKLGRTFTKVRSALEQAGRVEGSWYVERASMTAERVLPVADVDPATVPYFSIVLVPGDTRPGVARYDLPATRVTEPYPGAEVVVVGLGPGPDRWLSPRRRRCSPRSATSSATARTSSASRSAPDSSATPPATRSSSSGPGRRSNWRSPVSASRSSPAVTRASSAWRRRCSRPRRTPATPASPSVSYPGSPPSRRSRRARARRSGPISR